MGPYWWLCVFLVVGVPILVVVFVSGLDLGWTGALIWEMYERVVWISTISGGVEVIQIRASSKKGEEKTIDCNYWCNIFKF